VVGVYWMTDDGSVPLIPSSRRPVHVAPASLKQTMPRQCSLLCFQRHKSGLLSLAARSFFPSFLLTTISTRIDHPNVTMDDKSSNQFVSLSMLDSRATASSPGTPLPSKNFLLTRTTAYLTSSVDVPDDHAIIPLVGIPLSLDELFPTSTIVDGPTSQLGYDSLPTSDLVANSCGTEPLSLGASSSWCACPAPPMDVLRNHTADLPIGIPLSFEDLFPTSKIVDGPISQLKYDAFQTPDPVAQPSRIELLPSGACSSRDSCSQTLQLYMSEDTNANQLKLAAAESCRRHLEMVATSLPFPSRDLWELLSAWAMKAPEDAAVKTTLWIAQTAVRDLSQATRTTNITISSEAQDSSGQLCHLTDEADPNRPWHEVQTSLDRLSYWMAFLEDFIIYLGIASWSLAAALRNDESASILLRSLQQTTSELSPFSEVVGVWAAAVFGYALSMEVTLPTTGDIANPPLTPCNCGIRAADAAIHETAESTVDSASSSESYAGSAPLSPSAIFEDAFSSQATAPSTCDNAIPPPHPCNSVNWSADAPTPKRSIGSRGSATDSESNADSALLTPSTFSRGPQPLGDPALATCKIAIKPQHPCNAGEELADAALYKGTSPLGSSAHSETDTDDDLPSPSTFFRRPAHSVRKITPATTEDERIIYDSDSQKLPTTSQATPRQRVSVNMTRSSSPRKRSPIVIVISDTDSDSEEKSTTFQAVTHQPVFMSKARTPSPSKRLRKSPRRAKSVKYCRCDHELAEYLHQGASEWKCHQCNVKRPRLSAD
jgi:hypothetical protein